MTARARQLWGESLKLDEALSAIEAARSLAELRTILDSVAQARGFASYNFIDAGSISRDAPFWVGTTDENWEREYISNDFAPDDPIIRKALTQNLPFFWSDLKLSRRMGPKDRAHQTMDAAQDFGFRNGFVIPHHFRDDIGRTYSTCTCFFWKSAVRGFFKSVGSAKHDLHLIMMYWSAKASELGRQQFRAKAIPQPLGIAVEPNATAVTDRERDVLYWSAQGKTTEDISDILKISPATVNSYMRNAIKKLDASSRTHAVARAIYMGILSP